MGIIWNGDRTSHLTRRGFESLYLHQLKKVLLQSAYSRKSFSSNPDKVLPSHFSKALETSFLSIETDFLTFVSPVAGLPAFFRFPPLFDFFPTFFSPSIPDISITFFRTQDQWLTNSTSTKE